MKYVFAAHLNLTGGLNTASLTLCRLPSLCRSAARPGIILTMYSRQL